MNIKQRTLLEEKAKKLGKFLLIEETLLNISPEQVEEIKENLTESIEGKQYKSRAIVRNVPVSKYTENLNGRIYTRVLDEKMLKENVAEGTFSLADHPEDDGSIKDICGVWHNFRLGEHQSYADWHLVGEIGELIKEAIQAGSKGVGISRVGFGNFMEDGKTVDPEDYLLERLGDAVLNPSQQVYATYENLEEPKKDSPIQETITNKKNENIQPLKEEIEEKNKQEKNDEVKNMKFEESILRNNLLEGIRKAKSNPDLKEAILILKEAHVPEELSDIQNKIDQTIVELQEELNNQKSSAEAKVVELSKKNTEMEAEISSLKEQYKKAKAIIVKVGLDESVNVDELKENVKKMAEDISNYELNEKEMMKDLKAVDRIFEHKYAKKLEISKPSEFVDLMEDTFKRDKDLSYLKEQIKKFKHNLLIAEKHIIACEKELVKRGFKFSEETPEEDKTCSDNPVQEEEEIDNMELPEEEGDLTAGEEPVVEGEEFAGGEGKGDDDYEFSFDEENDAPEEGDEEIKVEEEDEDVMGVDGDEEEITEEDDMGGQEVTDDGQIQEDDDNDEASEEPISEPVIEEEEGEETILPDESEEVISEEDEEMVIDDSEVPVQEEDEGGIEDDEEGTIEPVVESVKPYRFNYNHNEKRIVRNSDLTPSAPTNKISKEALQERTLVKAFVVREVKKNAMARDIQKQLLASHTLKEAMGKLIRFENQKKQGRTEGLKIKRFSEKKETPLWLKGRK